MKSTLLAAVAIILLAGCGDSGFMTEHYVERMRYFHDHPAPVGAKIVIGDSITELWDIESHLPDSWINRGIGSDTVEGVLARLPEHLAEKPSEVALFIGVNNMEDDPGFIAPAYDAMINMIWQADSTIKIRVISLLPVGAMKFDRGLIDVVNTQVKAVCDKYNVPWEDANPQFKDANDWIIPELYENGGPVHPSAKGYDILDNYLL